MKDPGEQELISRCRSGQEAAWEELFQLHYSPVCRFLVQLASDFTREDVEELAQEVFLSAIRNLDRFQGQARLQTWLFRIAINKARDYREKRQAGKRGGGVLPVSLEAEDPLTGKRPDPPSAGPGPDARLIHQEECERVGQALHDLGDPCRQILELRYFGDLSYEEIAHALDLNPKTVSSRLSKCLDKLEGVYRAKNQPEKNAGISVQSSNGK